MPAEPKEWLVLGVTLLLGASAVLIFPLRFRTAWLLLVLGIPWASEVFQTDTLTLTLPTDGFAILGGLFIGLYILFSPGILSHIWQASILRWAILYLSWLGITIAFSTDPTVSLKFWLSQSAYFVTFGIGAYLWMRRASEDEYPLLSKLLLVSGIIVLGLCVSEHIQAGGTRATVNKSIAPFMREHTVYGAYSAWFFVMSIVFFALRPGLLTAVAMIISGAALFLSYSRGGWLSAILALGIWGSIEILRRLSPAVRFFLVATITLGVLIGGLFMMGYNPEVLRFRAKQRLGEAGEHFVSSFDIKKNPSNMERVNRWYAALQMIEERPLTGFGGNTFVQEYSAYQRSLTRTAISVEMGEVGGAHSEYLTAAAELGIPGLLLLLGIYFTTLLVGIRGMWRADTTAHRWKYALFTIPLLSYYLHGFINNFMDHGHIAGMVYLHWGILAALQREAVPSPYAELERA